MILSNTLAPSRILCTNMLIQSLPTTTHMSSATMRVCYSCNDAHACQACARDDYALAEELENALTALKGRVSEMEAESDSLGTQVSQKQIAGQSLFLCMTPTVGRRPIHRASHSRVMPLMLGSGSPAVRT